MFQFVGKHLFVIFFATVFFVFSAIAGPGLFLIFCYRHYFKEGNVAWMMISCLTIGLPVNLVFYFLYRLLFKMDTQDNRSVPPEIRIIFFAVVLMYCGFAFVLPCAVKLIIPTLSPLEGMLILVGFHLVGVVAAVIYCIIEIVKCRPTEE
jgi:hypothetical protein